MSTLKVPIVSFTLEKHPNADSLLIAHITGTLWICCVRTSDFQNDSLAAYIPIGSIADKDNSYLSFLEGKHVKSVKLRGVISQGVLLPLSKFAKPGKVYNIGDDVANELGVRKWIPPINNSLGSCEEIFSPEGFNKYTEIENWNRYPNIIKEGDEVFITEKIHGCNTRIALIEGIFYLGSHGRALQTEKYYTNEKGETFELRQTAWHKIVEQLDLKTKLEELKEFKKYIICNNIVVYGELYGRGIQSLTYGEAGYNFRVFDINIDGTYLDPIRCHAYAKLSRMDTVPILYKGIFKKELLNLRLGKDTISNSHLREGIIIEPIIPKYDLELGRVKLKVLNEEYLTKKGETDYGD